MEKTLASEDCIFGFERLVPCVPEWPIEVEVETVGDVLDGLSYDSG